MAAAKSPKLVYEGIMVLLGRETPGRFVVSVLCLFFGDLVLTREVLIMEPIYIPDGMLLPVILVLAIMAIAGPVLSAFFLKNQSKHKFADWSSRYVATMIIDMIVTPSIGLIVMSLIVQEWIPDISDVTYLVILPIVLLAVSYLALHLMNEGVKATVEQIKKLKGEIDEAKAELKP